MRGLFKLSIARDLVIIVCVLGIGFFLIWRPANVARAIPKNQIKQFDSASQDIAQATSDLQSIRNPALAGIRQVNVFKQYADEVSSLADKLRVVEIRYESPHKVFGLGVGRRGEAISAVNNQLEASSGNTAVEQSERAISSAQKLAGYHAAVTKALINILEYNPEDDMANFKPGSADTEHRLGLAKDGLEQTINGLRAAQLSYEDSSITQVVSEVSELQNQLQKLAAGGKVKLWIISVKSAQQRIVKNRSGFWEQSFSSQINQLLQSQKDLKEVKDSWSRLADKYGSA